MTARRASSTTARRPSSGSSETSGSADRDYPGAAGAPAPRVLLPWAPSVPSSTRRSVMSVFHSMTKLFRDTGRRKRTTARKPARPRLALEALEDRCLLATNLVPLPLAANGHAQAATLFQQINLVSDQVGVALNLDPTLHNAWGISAAPTSGAFWVSSNGRGLSELYLGDVNGSAIFAPFKVVIPGGSPTGQVFNINQPNMGTGNSTDFSVTDGTNTGASVFLFATKTGAITGWNPGVGTPMPTAFGPLSTEAEVGFQATDGAIFTGL